MYQSGLRKALNSEFCGSHIFFLSCYKENMHGVGVDEKYDQMHGIVLYVCKGGKLNNHIFPKGRMYEAMHSIGVISV
jgi:hypothetical protein